MAEIENADIETLYSKGLFVYRGRLVKVHSIDFGPQVNMTLWILADKRSITVPFSRDVLKAPSKRIGFVNIGQSVVYVVRCPHRKYQAGIHANNIELRTIMGVNYPVGSEAIQRKVKELTCVEIAAAYNGVYPSLEKCYELAVKHEGAWAFDKQFAVSHKGVVYYKTNAVGKYADGKIVFTEGNEYLENLLDGNYEKTSRTFSSSPL